MSKTQEIEELYKEAVACARYSKSKIKVKFWNLTNKLEKMLLENKIELPKDKREKLNMAKKKFA